MESKLQILQFDQDLEAEVGRELGDTQAQIGEYIERKVTAEVESYKPTRSAAS